MERDIIEHWFKDEKTYCPMLKKNLLKFIVESDRIYLVDWFATSLSYEKPACVLHMAVNLLDRCLLANLVKPRRLQLVAIVCFDIACKFECHELGTECMVYHLDHDFTREQIIDCEQTILVTLDWQICRPTPQTFLNYFLQCAAQPKPFNTICSFILDYTLFHISFVEFRPSLIAASTIYYTITTLFESPIKWNEHLEQCTTYHVDDLQPCYIEIVAALSKPIRNCETFQKIYTKSQYEIVANWISSRSAVSKVSKVSKV